MIIFDKDHAHALVLKAQSGDTAAYNEAGKLVLDMLNSISMKVNIIKFRTISLYFPKHS